MVFLQRENINHRSKMPALIIIAIIGFIIYSANKKKRLQPKNQRKVNTNIDISTPNHPDNDNSVIDVSGNSYQINYTEEPNSLKNYPGGVPFWSHHYVYSYSEINSATNEQKQFYFKFRDAFLKGTCYHLEGNTNYAFILFFDLIWEYEKHNDLALLEKQFDVLGKFYPKTMPYAKSYLLQEMTEKGDKHGMARLINNQMIYKSNPLDYDTYSWRNKYLKKLSLDADEVKLFNNLWYSGNNFCNIEYCCTEVLKLYFSVIKELKTKFADIGTTLDLQIKDVADVVARKHFKYRAGSNNYKYSLDSIPHEIHSNIFKYCENAVRENYGHKRKISTDTYFNSTPDAKTELETKIVPHVIEALAKLTGTINPPDEATEIELYAQNTTRWKIKFDELTSDYKDNSAQQFLEDVIKLGKLNKKNPSVENIFFEASKFMSKHDKEFSLVLYIHYLFHDLNSTSFDNKQLNKTIQKSLFKTEDQFLDFQAIVNNFLKDKDFKKAEAAISKIYVAKRKKIVLDKDSIKEVHEKHSGTVELLNEYLKDEEETITIKEENEEQIIIVEENPKEEKSKFSSDIALSPIQIDLLEMFFKCNFTVPQLEVVSFAKSKGVFKNQLIESINEMCYENLDDVLIEEEEDNYIINENYYQRILAQ